MEMDFRATPIIFPFLQGTTVVKGKRKTLDFHFLKVNSYIKRS